MRFGIRESNGGFFQFRGFLDVLVWVLVIRSSMWIERLHDGMRGAGRTGNQDNWVLSLMMCCHDADLSGSLIGQV